MLVGKVFINYRRDLSRGDARHLASLLAGDLDAPLDKLLGRSCVFIDLTGIDGFSDWFMVLKDQVAGTAAMISLIGPGWLDVRDKDGSRRLDNPDDFVRFEIREATSRRIPVLPVLLDGASVPAKDQLPKDMHGLLSWQAMRLDATHFERDAKEIGKELRKHLPKPSVISRRAAIAAALASLLLGAYVGRYWFADPPTNVLELRKELTKAQQERDEANGALSAAHMEASNQKGAAARAEAAWKAVDAARQDAESKLAAAKAEVGDANSRVNALQQKLEEARSRPVAAIIDEAAVGKAPGDAFRDCWSEGGKRACGPEMVVISSGKFLMGSPETEPGRESNEGPQHEVTIPKAFAVGKTHVTRAEFAAFIKATNYEVEKGCKTWTGSDWKSDDSWTWQSPGFDQGDDHPVVCVSWIDATAYVNWLSSATSNMYRLMSEAEIEYTARGSKEAKTQPRYFFGDNEKDLCRYANGADRTGEASLPNWAVRFPNWIVNTCNDSYIHTAPVGSFQPNAFLLYDVTGNAWSWVQDCWHGAYKDKPDKLKRNGGAWEEDGSCARVLRGGSWLDVPRSLRSAFRVWNTPGFRGDVIGFRVARTLSHL